MSALTVLPVSHHREDLILKNEELPFEAMKRLLSVRNASTPEKGEFERLQPDATRTIHTPFLVDLRDTCVHGVSLWSTLSQVYDSYYD